MEDVLLFDSSCYLHALYARYIYFLARGQIEISFQDELSGCPVFLCYAIIIFILEYFEITKKMDFRKQKNEHSS